VTRTRSVTRIVAVTLLAAAFLFSAIPAAYAERTIALSSGTFELALPAGGTASQTLAVANNGDDAFKALVYTNDIVNDEQGLPTYVKPTGAANEYLSSPASWLTLRMPATTQVVANTPYIELDPGEEMLIDFEMTVPEGAAPGDYNAVIFFEMFGGDAATGASSQVSGRIGARIVVRVAGDVVDRLDVAPYSVRGLVIGDTIPYSFTLTNEGNIDKRYVPSLVILDSSEAEVQRTVIEESAVAYAGDTRAYKGGLGLDTMLLGRYTVRAEIAYDRETGSAPGATVPEVLEKDRTVWILPLWFVIVVMMAVALPLLWLVWRSSVKKASSRRGPRVRGAHHVETGDAVTESSEPSADTSIDAHN